MYSILERNFCQNISKAVSFRKLDTHLNDSGFLICLKDALADDFKLFEERISVQGNQQTNVRRFRKDDERTKYIYCQRIYHETT